MSNGGLTAIIAVLVIVAVGLSVTIFVVIRRRGARRRTQEQSEKRAGHIFGVGSNSRSTSPPSLSSRPLLDPDDYMQSGEREDGGYSGRPYLPSGFMQSDLSQIPVNSISALRPNRLDDFTTSTQSHIRKSVSSGSSSSLGHPRSRLSLHYPYSHGVDKDHSEGLQTSLLTRLVPSFMRDMQARSDESRSRLSRPPSASQDCSPFADPPLSAVPVSLHSFSGDLQSPSAHSGSSRSNAATRSLPSVPFEISSRNPPLTAGHSIAMVIPNDSDSMLPSHFSSPSITPTSPRVEHSWVPSLLGNSSPWRNLISAVRPLSSNERVAPESPIVQNHRAYHEMPQYSKVSHQGLSDVAPRPLPLLAMTSVKE